MSYLAVLLSYRGELVKLSLLAGMPLFNSFTGGEFLNFGLQTLA